MGKQQFIVTRKITILKRQLVLAVSPLNILSMSYINEVINLKRNKTENSSSVLQDPCQEQLASCVHLVCLGIVEICISQESCIPP